MKNRIILIFVPAILASCSKVFYSTNGETIYRTGKNLNGEKLLNQSASRIKIVNSCLRLGSCLTNRNSFFCQAPMKLFNQTGNYCRPEEYNWKANYFFN